MCSCLKSRLTSLDILNFARYVATIKHLSRVILYALPVEPPNINVMVYFFPLNKAQRARENERNMNAHAVQTEQYVCFCTHKHAFSRAQKRTFRAILTVIDCVFNALSCVVEYQY